MTKSILAKHTVWILLVSVALPAALIAAPIALTNDVEAGNEAPLRPIIVLIQCDDLGYADVGFNGCRDSKTPKIDQLAKGGTVFSSPMNISLTLELRHPHTGWQGQQIFPISPAATIEGFPTAMEVGYARVWRKE